MQPSGETKRRRTEDEQSRMSSMRPAMAPPIRQSNIRKVSTTQVLKYFGAALTV